MELRLLRATAGVLFISIRDKNKDMRQTSLGALAAGLLGGVSEPSLYGIHLRYKLIYKRMLVAASPVASSSRCSAGCSRPSLQPANRCAA